MSEAATIDSQQYQQFIQQFGSRTQHIFIGKNCHLGQSSFIAQTYYNQQMHSLFPSIFPAIITSTASSSSCQFLHANCHDRYFASNPLVKYHLLPVKKQGFEWLFDSLPSREQNLLQFQSEITSRPSDISSQLQSLQQQCKHIHSLQPTNSTDRLSLTDEQQSLLSINPTDRILFLGTGCAIPSKYRNVSSIFLYIEQTTFASGILLDAGAGTWNQLLHLIPPSNHLAYMQSFSIELQWALLIKVIWISHPHADHHLGLIRIIQERYSLLQRHNFQLPPVIIIAPFSVWRFLEECCEIFPDLRRGYVYMPTKYFEPVEMCLSCQPTSNVYKQ